MLQEHTLRLVADYLHQIGATEQDIEATRNILCQDSNFSPMHMFNEIDKNQLGISAYDLSDFVQYMKGNIPLHELEYVIQYYDEDEDGRLNYDEFLNFVIPETNDQLAGIAQIRDSYLTPNVAELFYHLLNKEIDGQKNVMQYKNELQRTFDFTFDRAFDAVDEYETGYISMNNLLHFMKKSGHAYGRSVIQATMRRIGSVETSAICRTEFKNALGSEIGQKRNSPVKKPARTRSSAMASPKTYYSSAKSPTSYHNAMQAAGRSPLRSQYLPSRSRREDALPNSWSRMNPAVSSHGPMMSSDLLAQSSYLSPGIPSISQFSSIAPSPQRAKSPLRSTANYASVTSSPQRAAPLIQISSPPRAASPLRATAKYASVTSSPQRVAPHLQSSAKYASRTSSPMRAASPSRATAKYSSLASSPQRASSPLRASMIRSPAREGTQTLQQEFQSSSVDTYDIAVKFHEQIDLDRLIEQAKIDLANKADFNFGDLFHMVDKLDKGYVNTVDLEKFLSSFGVTVPYDELHLIISRYSHGKDVIKLTPFCQIFLPRDPELRRQMNKRDNQKLRCFEVSTQRVLAELMKLHIQAESLAEGIRELISASGKFSAHDLFTTLDLDRNGLLSREELVSLLRKYGIVVGQEEADMLLKRYDGNKDGVVTYGAFMSSVEMKSPFKR